MEKLTELEIFEEVLSQSKNSLIEAALSEGDAAIGYNCCMVPTPLLNVKGLFPVHLRAPEVTTTETADFYLSHFNCSYSRSILENGLIGNYDWVGGIVFAASCIHVQRVEHMFKIKGVYSEKQPFLSYMIDTPRKSFPAGLEALANDLRKLGKLLAETYGVDTSKKAVTEAIKSQNVFNRKLKEIADLRKGSNPLITGTELLTVLAACQAAPYRLLEKPLADLGKALKRRGGIAFAEPRIMVVGARIDDPDFLELIEAQGCFVAADRFCFGSLPGLELIEEKGDPYVNLANHYLEVSECPRMMAEADKRLDHLFGWFDEYGCDGIVLEVMKFCDLWGWEVIKVEEEARKRGIPTVRIEREYHLSGQGQLQTRIQAFRESIANKKLDAQLCAKS